MESNTQIKVPLLNDANYLFWKKQMKGFLESKDLWKVCKHASYEESVAKQKERRERQERRFIKGETFEVKKEVDEKAVLSGDGGKPTLTTESSKTASVAVPDKSKEKIPNEKEAKRELKKFEAGREKWEQDDRKVRGIIPMYVDQKHASICKNADEDFDTAFDMWERLRAKGEKEMATGVLNLATDYEMARMNDREKPSEFLGRVKLMAEKLHDLGEDEIKDQLIVRKVVAFLRPEFQPMKMMLTVTMKTMSVSELNDYFLMYQGTQIPSQPRNQGREKRGNPEGHNAGQGQRGGGNTPKGGKPKESRICFKCGVKGHIASGCRAPKDKQERYQQQRKEEKEQAANHTGTGQKPQPLQEKQSNPQQQEKKSNTNGGKSKPAEGHGIIHQEFLDAIEEIDCDDVKYFEEYLAESKRRKQDQANSNVPENSDEGVCSSSDTEDPEMQELSDSGRVQESTPVNEQQIQVDENDAPEALYTSRHKKCIDSVAGTTWILDSGATQHMTNDTSLLENARDSNTPITAALGDPGKSTQTGDVLLTCKVNRELVELSLENVLGIPDLKRNLCSVSQICEQYSDTKVIFDAIGFQVIQSDNIILEGHQRNGLYFFHDTATAEANIIEISDKLRVWHERLGHLSISQMKLLSSEIDDKDVEKELKQIKLNDTRIECVACDRGKKTREHFNRESSEEIKKIGDVVYSDLSGRIAPPSIGYKEYYITFTDGKSRYSKIAFLEKKSDALTAFKHYWNELNTQKGIRIKKLVTDEGSDYVNQDFKQFCLKKGIKHVVTPPYTPQQNGISERLNLTIMNKVRCMLAHRNIPPKFWAEAACYANYLKNMSPTQILKGKTPYEIYHKKKPDLKMVRTFGCRVMYKDNAQKKKLADRSFVGTFVGVDDNKYRIWNIKRRTVEFSRDVTFYEKEGEETVPEQITIEYSQESTSDSEDQSSGNQSDSNDTTRASSTQPQSERFEIVLSSDSSSRRTSSSSSESEISGSLGENQDFLPQQYDQESIGNESSERSGSDNEPSIGNESGERSGSDNESSGSEESESEQPEQESESEESHSEKSSKSDDSDSESDTSDEGNSKDEDETPNLPLHKVGTNVECKFKVGKGNATKKYQGKIKKVHKNHTYDVYFYEDQQTTRYLKHQKLAVIQETQLSVKIEEPQTWNEMLNSTQKDDWMKAVQAELKSLQDMKTWSEIERKPTHKLIDSKWVFKLKYKPDGSIERYKARLVARGFMQKQGIDYSETYAPVVNCKVLRFLISHATKLKLEIDQMDVETAFLHGELEEEVYMKIPVGLTGIASNKVLKLNRSLYGLKQSPRCWNKKFTTTLRNNGYAQSTADSCLFVRKTTSPQSQYTWTIVSSLVHAKTWTS